MVASEVVSSGVANRPARCWKAPEATCMLRRNVSGVWLPFFHDWGNSWAEKSAWTTHAVDSA